MSTSADVVILQNYFTPYRHKLFEAMGGELGRMTVVHSRRPDQDGRKWREEPSVNYTTLRAPSISIGPLVFFAMPWCVLRNARRKIVVLHDDNPANLSMIGWAALLRLFGARTMLWSEHIPSSDRGLKARYQRGCSWLLERLVYLVVAFSSMTETYVRGLAPRCRVERMLQSVPRPATAPSPRSGRIRRFGFIGSMQPRKNLDVLLAAFAAIEDAELHVAGVPPREADPRIKWWGYVDGGAREDFFASIDMLVLPSLKEPWGLVVNEALDRGALAMVSTECGSRDMVEAIDSGLMFAPTRDGIEAALRRWSTHDIGALGDKAARVARDYSTSAAAKRFLDIIADVRR